MISLCSGEVLLRRSVRADEKAEGGSETSETVHPLGVYFPKLSLHAIRQLPGK